VACFIPANEKRIVLWFFSSSFNRRADPGHAKNELELELELKLKLELELELELDLELKLKLELELELELRSLSEPDSPRHNMVSIIPSPNEPYQPHKQKTQR
jgi:hypothetical protein